MSSPDGTLSLEDAAACLGVAPHLIVFWQRRCGGFRLTVERDGRQFVRRGDMSLLFAMQRLLVNESAMPASVADIILKRSPSAIINDGDRRAARAALAGNGAGNSAGSRADEAGNAFEANAVAASTLSPEQIQALKQLSAAADSLDTLRKDLAGFATSDAVDETLS